MLADSKLENWPEVMAFDAFCCGDCFSEGAALLMDAHVQRACLAFFLLRVVAQTAFAMVPAQES
jgi:hypothetical protein